ncbi:MAG TPA: bifunctional phosphoribosylaminoimidazolecarboxamide formyltransferase/IMP cyclohydrolase [Polyangia bacterium]|nr:bifunctional phosphoribosylaminoimidazolecarboxamide formyltransferase/IMP cyclohydrolase [Polyangia bacterium]
MANLSKLSRALVSVSNKAGLVEFAKGLSAVGLEILSTGGTAKTLAEAGVPVREVSDFTGAPEVLDGRVKTLHPRVHGGILGRPTEKHRKEMQQAGFVPIDLVVVNLYPFRETVARGAPFEEVIENIDIGGPAMIRSAAKNHERVAVIVDPADYARVLSEIQATGEVSAATRYALARKAFAHTAAYDGAIASHLGRLASPEAPLADFPDTLHLSASLARALRYGENPHQKAAFYAIDAGLGPEGKNASLAKAEVIQGKELSYNNILDLDAAMRLCAEFTLPAAAIIKHNNPCGAAVAHEGVGEAYRRARDTDPVSAYGGIVAVNREVDAALARDMSETFLECVIAPSYSAEALAALAPKKNLRLLKLDASNESWGDVAGALELRSVAGGVLVQARDATAATMAASKVVSKRTPTAEELADLDFAWRVCKHVKSNAIVFAARGRTLGVGAGQMSRVDSVRIAVSKARSSLKGSVCASDAFFPFRDGVDEAAKAGAIAVVEPGGSVRDEEAIASANEHGMTMVFTGERHFRH